LSPLYVRVSRTLWRPHTKLAYFSESLSKISATSWLPWPVDMVYKVFCFTFTKWRYIQCHTCEVKFLVKNLVPKITSESDL
jgi:DNA-directed RNA polymerase subunit RPC12/RpoP